jgi:hypothetical protein
MLRHRVPRSTLRVPQALRVGLSPYIFGTVTRSAQGIPNRRSLPDEHIEPLFDTSHLARSRLDKREKDLIDDLGDGPR